MATNKLVKLRTIVAGAGMDVQEDAETITLTNTSDEGTPFSNIKRPFGMLGWETVPFVGSTWNTFFASANVYDTMEINVPTLSETNPNYQFRRLEAVSTNGLTAHIGTDALPMTLFRTTPLTAHLRVGVGNVEQQRWSDAPKHEREMFAGFYTDESAIHFSVDPFNSTDAIGIGFPLGSVQLNANWQIIRMSGGTPFFTNTGIVKSANHILDVKFEKNALGTQWILTVRTITCTAGVIAFDPVTYVFTFSSNLPDLSTKNFHLGCSALSDGTTALRPGLEARISWHQCAWYWDIPHG
jgi:hypothetical protein